MTDKFMHEKILPKYVKHERPTVARLVSEHRIKRVEDSENILLQASAWLPCSRWVFVDKANRNIKLYDAEFRFVSMTRLSTYPFDVCVSRRNIYEFYVTEPEARMVHCFNIEFGQLKLVQSLDIEEECRGITCWRKGLALTVMRDAFKGTLGILDYKGKVKRKCWESEHGDPLFRAPWYLASGNSGNHVIVSDQGNNTVICLHVKRFDVIFSCSSRQLINPRSLTVDVSDNVYVIGNNETNHYVMKISPEGKPLGVILTRQDKLNYPSGIGFCNKGNVFILQPNREKPIICVYDI